MNPEDERLIQDVVDSLCAAECGPNFHAHEMAARMGIAHVWAWGGAPLGEASPRHYAAALIEPAMRAGKTRREVLLAR